MRRMLIEIFAQCEVSEREGFPVGSDGNANEELPPTTSLSGLERSTEIDLTRQTEFDMFRRFALKAE